MTTIRGWNVGTAYGSAPADHESTVLAQYRGWLRSVAAGLITDQHLREDLAAEGWIAMWRALRAFNPDRGALPAWLTYKAYRRMLDCSRDRTWLGRPARHQGRTPVRHVQEVATAPDAEIWEQLAAPDTHDALLWAYHQGAILDAVNRLSPAQRRYVYARFWQGMTSGELTRLYGYDPHGLWDSRVNGARMKLRADLSPLV